MNYLIKSRRFSRPVLRCFLPALALVLALVGCSKFHHTDTQLDQAGMWVNSVEQLRELKISDAEVQQLVLAHQAGLTDASCIELVRISHARQEIFASGQTAGGLLAAGFHEDAILELARLNQLGAWSGEAQAIRLAGLSDEVVLAAAKRRAAGQPVFSSRKIVDLRNAGLTQSEIIVQINRGATDADADDIVARRTYAAGGHSFVSQRGLRRR